jgi:putative flippase GtrA
MNMNRLKQLPEFIRFIIVGTFATGLHYGLYFVLQRVINVNMAYSIGYILSFIANFYLTAFFTFRRKASWKKAFGFGGAHLINYLLHIGLLNLFLWLGLSKPLAPIPVFAIAIPVNFLLVRFVFKYKGR